MKLAWNWKSVMSIFVVTCFTIACHSALEENSASIQTSNYDLISISSPLLEQDWTHYLSIREVISLETTAHSALQGVSEVLMIKNRFYVAHYQSAAIKVFSREGKFLFDIGRLGRGPGEFLYMLGISYDPERDQLIVFCNDKVARFQPNGTFVNEDALPFYPYRFEWMGPDQYAFYMGNNDYIGEITKKHNLIITDDDFEVINKGLPYQGTSGSYRMSGYICQSSNGVLAQNSFSDDVYEYDKGRNFFYVKYRLDFNVDRKELPMGHPELSKTRREEGYLHSPFYEDQTMFSFHYIYQDEFYGAVWLRGPKKLLTGRSFPHGILSYYLFPPAGQTEDGIPIAAIVPSEYYSNIPNDDPDFLPFLQENYPQLYEVSKDLDGSENPILVLYEIHPEGAAAALNQK